jgi:hypothetical protein
MRAKRIFCLLRERPAILRESTLQRHPGSAQSSGSAAVIGPTPKGQSISPSSDGTICVLQGERAAGAPALERGQLAKKAFGRGLGWPRCHESTQLRACLHPRSGLRHHSTSYASALGPAAVCSTSSPPPFITSAILRKPPAVIEPTSNGSTQYKSVSRKLPSHTYKGIYAGFGMKPSGASPHLVL